VSTRARLAIAVAIALLSAAGIVILSLRWFAGAPRAAVPRGLRETHAVAPFAGYREVRLAVGARCARVVVADTPARRERGLRGAGDLGPYAGMLFAQRADTNIAFTMADLTAPLEITWYSARGVEVEATRMPPCPRDAARCPVYRSGRAYRFALETPPGPSGPIELQPCA
jgi:uncharacterized membrane protein (UPF0127 family)